MISLAKETAEWIPHKVGEYHILRNCGESGMSTLYLAEHESRRHRVYLRLLDAKFMQIESVQQKAKQLLNFHGNGLVPIREIGESDGKVFLISPFLVGATLDKIFASLPQTKKRCSTGMAILDGLKQNLEEKERNLGDQKYWSRDLWIVLADWFQQLARGLDNLHQAGIVHGNVKHANIFITPFGRALLLDPALNGNPSQAEGDIYALGKILRGLLPKRQGWGVLRSLHRIAAAATADRAHSCYESAGAMAADLEAVLEGKSIRAPKLKAGFEPSSPMRKRIAAAALFLLMTALASATGVAAGIIAGKLLWNVDFRAVIQETNEDFSPAKEKESEETVSYSQSAPGYQPSSRSLSSQSVSTSSPR